VLTGHEHEDQDGGSSSLPENSFGGKWQNQASRHLFVAHASRVRWENASVLEGDRDETHRSGESEWRSDPCETSEDAGGGKSSILSVFDFFPTTYLRKNSLSGYGVFWGSGDTLSEEAVICSDYSGIFENGQNSELESAE
jgi:hypothetical protein